MVVVVVGIKLGGGGTTLTLWNLNPLNLVLWNPLWQLLFSESYKVKFASSLSKTTHIHMHMHICQFPHITKSTSIILRRAKLNPLQLSFSDVHPCQDLNVLLVLLVF